MSTTLYVLRFKSEKDRKKYRRPYLGVTCSGNEDVEFCGTYSASLDPYSDSIWTQGSLEKAEMVANSNIEWYNSDLDTPQNPYEGQLEVVEFVLKEV